MTDFSKTGALVKGSFFLAAFLNMSEIPLYFTLLMKTIILFLFFVVPSLAIAQTLPDNSDWKSFKKSDYSISYPSDWNIDTSRVLGSDAFFFSPKESEADKFSENVNILVQNLKGMNINLDRFVEISEGQIKNLVTDGQLLESKRISENGKEFQRLVYTGRQGVFSLKTIQYYIIVNEKAYVITFVSEVSMYDKYERVGLKVLDSFRLN